MFVSGKYVKPEFEEKAKQLLNDMQVVHVDDNGNVYSDDEICNNVYINGQKIENPYGPIIIKSQIDVNKERCSSGKIKTNTML